MLGTRGRPQKGHISILCPIYAFYGYENSGQQGTTQSAATLPKGILKNTSDELVKVFTPLLHYFVVLSYES